MNENNKTEIKIRNLSVHYSGKESGKIVALNNINADIPRNKITMIMGPSGCGKTTLLKSINRLLDIRENVKIEGEIFIGEKDIYHPEQFLPDLRKKVGLVSQKPFPLPSSIYGNVAYGPRIHLKKDKRELDLIVEESLKKVNLWEEVKDRLNSPGVDLSVGQQQRLCIARALAVNPEVILCDELTSALDPVSSQRIENLLKSLKNDYTIVVVSHMLRQVKRLADFILFLYLGELVESGSAVDVLERPKEKKTKEYIRGIIS